MHIHLISDSTGETLMAVERAVSGQYENVTTLEHVYPLVRNKKQLDRVLIDIEETPGIILYTMVDQEMSELLEKKAADMSMPCINVLEPVSKVFQSYLGRRKTPRIGAQHTLNAEYFKRIDSLNFTLAHDDGQNMHELEEAEIVLLGISRTSKTPTSIYIANRGYRTANIPIVPELPLPPEVEALKKPLVIGLVASADRIAQIRTNRILSYNMPNETNYVDKRSISDELTYFKKLCARNGWKMIDVSRRSIEETAAEVIALYKERESEK
jgi:regulator of PEP synthase PpsR (kinase-PPPase family)